MVGPDSPVISRHRPIIGPDSPVVSWARPLLARLAPEVGSLGPVASDCAPLLSPRFPVVSLRLLVVSQRNPAVSRHDAIVGETRPVLVKLSPALSAFIRMVGHLHPALGPHNPVTSGVWVTIAQRSMRDERRLLGCLRYGDAPSTGSTTSAPTCAPSAVDIRSEPTRTRTAAARSGPVGLPQETRASWAHPLGPVRRPLASADRYRIERELGVGGMATVQLAHDLKHNRAVAIKVRKPHLAESLGREGFVREIRLAARLTHPHILPL